MGLQVTFVLLETIVQALLLNLYQSHVRLDIIIPIKEEKYKLTVFYVILPNLFALKEVL